MSDPRFALLEELTAHLEGTLEALEDPGPRGALALKRSQACLAQCFLRFQALEEGEPGARRPYPPALRERVEDVLRLEAIVSSLAARWHGALGEELTGLRRTRQSLRQLERREGQTGRSCDLQA